MSDSQEEKKSRFKHFIFAVMNCLINMIFHKGRVCVMLLKQQCSSKVQPYTPFACIFYCECECSWQNMVVLSISDKTSGYYNFNIKCL